MLLMLRVVGPEKFESFVFHFAVVDFDARFNCFASAFGNCLHNDFLDFFQAGALNHLFEGELKVLDVSLLAGLRNSSASFESFEAVICNSVDEIARES